MFGGSDCSRHSTGNIMEISSEQHDGDGSVISTKGTKAHTISIAGLSRRFCEALPQFSVATFLDSLRRGFEVQHRAEEERWRVKEMGWMAKEEQDEI